ncbi:GumC family protein [Synechococcus sp. BDU 130192]|uniref:GumC family protein n=1 Tax=Synechococcus sp. BDU 130192 TaxID=2042059 RepID=UPI000C070884|nr:polysaccharide biosynthesis tyrosine autokinase [Synechococcus sp. BDU 130192]
MDKQDTNNAVLEYQNNGHKKNGAVAPIPYPVSPLLQPVDYGDDFDFRQFLSVMRRRAWLILGVITVGMGAVTFNTFSQEKIYLSKFRLLVEPVNSNNNVSDLAQSLQPGSGRAGELDYSTQIQVLRSPELLQKVIQPLQQQYPNLNYNTLLSNLSITRPGETKILEVSYQNPDPDQIEAVLEQLSSVYLEYSLADRQTNVRQGLQFIDEQLPDLQQEVDTLQAELQQFRQNYNFTEPEIHFNQLAQKAATLEQQRFQLQQEIAQAQTRLQSLQGDRGALAALENSETYQQVLGQLRSVEANIAKESTRFQNDSLNIQVLREERQNLLPILQQEAERVGATQVTDAANQLRILQARIPSLNQAQAEVEQSFQNLAVLNRLYTDLQRRLGISTEALTELLARRQALQVQAAQTEIPWEVIEGATRPNLPISPNIQRSLMLGFIASSVLGVGAALLLDKLTDVYYSPDDLKNRTKLPLLANIPYEEQHGMAGGAESSLPPLLRFQRWLTSFIPASTTRTWQKMTSGDHPYGYYGASAFSESLRVLHTNLKLLSADRPLRSVIIASALPGDGKSTIALNLAPTAAILGQKVLLVDSDMRRPQVAQRLNLNQKQGLSTVITNNSSETEIESYLQKPMPLVDFSVLPAGTLPPDPAKLLASQKMKHLVEEFERTFDFVVYDTPPVLGLADTSLLASHADGVILVVTLNKTTRSAVSQAIATFKQANIPILGLVANSQTKGTSSSSYSYSYYGSQSKKRQ